MQSNRFDNISVCIVLLLYAVGFFVLDMQSVPTGDDLGYMFADTTHHAGDGARVETAADITRTLGHHYLTTNGRFLAHWIAMFFLNFGGHTAFCIVNSLVFLITVVGFCQLGMQRRRISLAIAALAPILLWLALPEPGMTWLGLVCYATNYLWPCGASLLFLLLLDRYGGQADRQSWLERLSIAGVCIFSLIAGSLQESFSLPISGALLVWLAVNRKAVDSPQLLLMIFYWSGTLACILAPGNIHHSEQGGGFTVAALCAKNIALGKTLIDRVPLISVCLAVWVVALVTAHRKTLQFFKANLLLVVAIVLALLLAVMTFTSARQLTAPAVLSAILLMRGWRAYMTGRIPRWIARKTATLLSWSLVAVYGVVTVMVWNMRQPTSQALQSLHDQATLGNKVLIYDLPEMPADGIGRWMYRRFDFRQLPAVFDGYTKRGLSRLYSPGHEAGYISTILPASVQEISAKTGQSHHDGLQISTVPLKTGFRCFRLPEGVEVSELRDSQGHSLPGYERIWTPSGELVVIPDRPILEKLQTVKQ